MPREDHEVAVRTWRKHIQECEGIKGMGRVLAKGNFVPQARAGSSTQSQDFTVTVPENMAHGPAVLSVAHFFLLGVSVLLFQCVVDSDFVLCRQEWSLLKINGAVRRRHVVAFVREAL